MGNSIAKLFIYSFILAALVAMVVGVFLGNPTRGQAIQESTRTHELLSLQISKEQVQSGSL